MIRSELVDGKEKCKELRSCHPRYLQQASASNKETVKRLCQQQKKKGQVRLLLLHDASHYSLALLAHSVHHPLE